jgi:hypothetical protein
MRVGCLSSSAPSSRRPSSSEMDKHTHAAPNEDRTPEYVTLEAASGLASPNGIPIATLRYWIQVGKLRGFRPGRRVLVRLPDVIALIEGTASGRRSAMAGGAR